MDFSQKKLMFGGAKDYIAPMREKLTHTHHMDRPHNNKNI